MSWLRGRGWAIAFVVVYLWSFPWFPSIHSANELPRAYLTIAMAEHGRFSIDEELARDHESAGGDMSAATLVTGRIQLAAIGATVSDKAIRHGREYSNKAPGSSILALPGYFALAGWHRVVGGEPSLAEVVWMSRLSTGMIPSLLFLWMLWRFLARFAPEGPRRAVMVGLGVGSMYFLYSILFISHPLSAVCIGAAWILAVDAAEEPARWARFTTVGLLAGAAPLVDYQAAFAAVPVMIYVIVKIARWPRRDAARAIAAAVLGAAPPIATLLVYHWACFGGALVTGYDASEAYAANHQHGFLGMDGFVWGRLVGSTVSADNGILILWPMILLAIPGWVLMLRRRTQRGHAAVTLAVALIYIAFISSINFWRGGWQVGPRYVMAMLPFLTPPIAVAIAASESRWWLRGAAVGVCLVGLVSYGLTAALYPYFPDSGFKSPIREITLRMLGDGHVPWNLGWLVGLRGIASLAPYLALLVALAGWAAWPRGARWGDRRAIGSMAIAFAVAALLCAGYFAFGTGGAIADHKYATLVATMPT